MTKLWDVDAEGHLRALTINMMSFPMSLSLLFSVSDRGNASYYFKYRSI